jgi:LacI family transcriptional regulator
MTSNDIAKLAGVSRSTVSRVLNRYGNVPEETRRKVMSVIQRYDYIPNVSARSLAGKPHNTVGLFIVSVAENRENQRIYQNNYLGPLVEIIVDAINSRGYFALVNIIYNKKDYVRVKQTYLQQRIDCCIIIGAEMEPELIDGIANVGCPLSIIDFDPAEAKKRLYAHKGITIVNAMNYRGAYDAVEYLIGNGHTEIALLAGRNSTYSGRERYDAYIDAMLKHDLPIRDEYVLHGEFMKSNAVRELTRLFESSKPPTAIFSCNDDMAIAAIEFLRPRGIRVPQDISIVGFDDIAAASQIVPALTTVRVPIADMARKAEDAVIRSLANADQSQNIISFPTELIIRDSCINRKP